MLQRWTSLFSKTHFCAKFSQRQFRNKMKPDFDTLLYANKAEEVIPTLSPKYLGHYATSASTLYYQDERIWNVLQNTIEKNLSQLDPHDCFRILKAFCAAKNTNHAFLHTLASTTLLHAQELRTQEIAVLCEALASHKILHPQFYAAMAIAFNYKIGNASPIDIVIMARTYASLGIKDPFLMSKIAVSSVYLFELFTPSHICQLLRSYAQMGIRNDPFFMKSIDRISKNLQKLSYDDVTHLLFFMNQFKLIYQKILDRVVPLLPQIVMHLESSERVLELVNSCAQLNLPCNELFTPFRDGSISLDEIEGEGLVQFLFDMSELGWLRDEQFLRKILGKTEKTILEFQKEIDADSATLLLRAVINIIHFQSQHERETSRWHAQTDTREGEVVEEEQQKEGGSAEGSTFAIAKRLLRLSLRLLAQNISQIDHPEKASSILRTLRHMPLTIFDAMNTMTHVMVEDSLEGSRIPVDEDSSLRVIVASCLRYLYQYQKANNSLKEPQLVSILLSLMSIVQDDVFSPSFAERYREAKKEKDLMPLADVIPFFFDSLAKQYYESEKMILNKDERDDWLAPISCSYMRTLRAIQLHLPSCIESFYGLPSFDYEKILEEGELTANGLEEPIPLHKCLLTSSPSLVSFQTLKQALITVIEEEQRMIGSSEIAVSFEEENVDFYVPIGGVVAPLTETLHKGDKIAWILPKNNQLYRKSFVDELRNKTHISTYRVNETETILANERERFTQSLEYEMMPLKALELRALTLQGWKVNTVYPDLLMQAKKDPKILINFIRAQRAIP